MSVSSIIKPNNIKKIDNNDLLMKLPEQKLQTKPKPKLQYIPNLKINVIPKQEQEINMAEKLKQKFDKLQNKFADYKIDFNKYKTETNSLRDTEKPGKRNNYGNLNLPELEISDIAKIQNLKELLTNKTKPNNEIFDINYTVTPDVIDDTNNITILQDIASSNVYDLNDFMNVNENNAENDNNGLNAVVNENAENVNENAENVNENNVNENNENAENVNENNVNENNDVNAVMNDNENNENAIVNVNENVEQFGGDGDELPPIPLMNLDNNVKTIINNLINDISPDFKIIIFFIKQNEIPNPLPPNLYMTADNSYCVGIKVCVTHKFSFGTKFFENIKHDLYPDLIDISEVYNNFSITSKTFRRLNFDNTNPDVYTPNQNYSNILASVSDDSIFKNTLFQDMTFFNYMDHFKLYCCEIESSETEFVPFNDNEMAKFIITNLDSINYKNEQNVNFTELLNTTFTDFEVPNYTRDEPVITINANKDDTYELQCYTSHWDKYINPLSGNFPFATSVQFNLNYLDTMTGTGKTNKCRRYPDPTIQDLANVHEVKKQELLYKICYYRFVMFTKARISNKDGVVFKDMKVNALWRGMSKPYNIAYGAPDPDGVQRTFLLKNFTSASLSENTALSFLGTNTNTSILYRFKIQQGIPYISYDFVPFSSNFGTTEFEVLFAERCLIRIIGNVNGTKYTICNRTVTVINAIISYSDLANLAVSHQMLTQKNYKATFLGAGNDLTIVENKYILERPEQTPTLLQGGNRVKQKTIRNKKNLRIHKSRKTQRSK
jgi:hypothetical protein